ncbi:MAG: hydrolase Nlp/P60 [Sphingobacteriaceae bacterium]|nr:hydrolase Nlp/P60 [Sphingobacteriaceae bacterium]
MNPHKMAAVPVVPVRREPADRSEQITQWLYDEPLELLEEREKWSLLRSLLDGYEGWVDNKQIRTAPADFNGKVHFVTTPFTQLAGQQGSMWLAHGTRLLLNEAGYTPGGLFADNGQCLPTQNATATSLATHGNLYLGTSYLWGGRSIWGIDCSGLMQQLYRVHGINLPRDAYQQATVGETVHLIGESKPGDLAFFDNEEGRIIHVGMVLPDSKILHASGKVRIDQLDHFGIFNTDNQRYSHTLRLITRVL